MPWTSTGTSYTATAAAASASRRHLYAAAAQEGAPPPHPTARYGTYVAPPLPKSEVRYRAAAAAPAAPAAPAAAPLPPSAVGPSSASFVTQVSRAAPRPAPTTICRANGARPRCSPQLPRHLPTQGRALLVLDLDETLVHASVEPVPHDVAFSVPMENQAVVVYVKLRPGVHEFLRRAARLFEVAVFTASLSQYADQVVDFLDPSGALVHHRLFREHCTFVDGSYVKDLSLLGRPLESIAIVDNSPVAYSFHQDNAIPILSWFDDPRDRELDHLLPLLHDFAATRNIYHVGGAANSRVAML